MFRVAEEPSRSDISDEGDGEGARSTPTDRSDWTISLHENGTADDAIVVVDTLNGAFGR